MTVKLKIVPQQDWEILKRYLDAEGVVLVPESNEAGVSKLIRHGLTDNETIDYEFGGDANVWVDLALSADSYAINELCENYQINHDFELTPEVIESLKIQCLLYGSDNGGQSYFVQTCCDQDHLGNDCGCRSLGENFSKEEAEAFAKDLSLKFNLPACQSC